MRLFDVRKNTIFIDKKKKKIHADIAQRSGARATEDGADLVREIRGRHAIIPNSAAKIDDKAKTASGKIH